MTYQLRGGPAITIVEQGIKGSVGQGQMYDTDDSQAREVTLDGRRGTLIARKDGNLHLRWLAADTLLDLYGVIGEEEALTIAASLSPVTRN